MITAKIKSEDQEVYIGCYYEMPDGKIACLTCWNGIKKTFSFYCDDGLGLQESPCEELKKWVLCRDLNDFPNSSDPRLPYVFDLFWDLKRVSELRYGLEHGHEDSDLIRDEMVRWGISL
jgi:hypothetical protein